MSFISRIWRWIFPAKKKVAKRTKSKRQPKEHTGAHYYIGDLLKQLDGIFKDLPKFKKLDPDAFGAYQRIGATILSSDCLFTQQLEPVFKLRMPSFGCVFLGGANTDEYLGLRFGCFTKETRPINIEVSNGTTYRCTVTYDFDGKPVADQFFIAIEGGKIRALRQCVPRFISFGSSKKQGVARMEWQKSDFLEQGAKKHGETLDKYAEHIFSMIANAVLTRESGMTVKVKKRNMAAVFAIDMLRTPYFFADREKVKTESGATKKIIHIVRTHERIGADGNKSFVKSHFRGLREFDWNGYSVRVSMAGKHGLGLSEFNVNSADPLINSGEMLDQEAVAERIEGILA